MILGLLALAAAAPLVEIPPERVLLIVLSPPSLGAKISSSEIFEIADRIFRETAYVHMVSAEQTGVSAADFDSCPVEVRASCWVKLALRTDARVLLLVSLQPDAIATIAIDLAKAATSVLGDAEDAERAVWSQTVRSEAERNTNLRAYFEKRARTDVGLFLAKLAPHDHFGALHVENIAAGSELELDGKNIGVSTASTARIEGVTIGSRRVRAKQTSGENAELIAIVRGRETTLANFAIVPTPLFTPAVKISLGAVGVVAGAALFAVPAPDEVCIYRADAADCDRGARPAIIVGSGLIAAGATWSIATWLAEDLSPWWIAAGSVAAGALTSLIVQQAK